MTNSRMKSWRIPFAVLMSLVIVMTLVAAASADDPIRVRRNFFGNHNLKDGGPEFHIGMDWTAELNGPGFIFDWVTDPIPWVEAAFQRGLIPCIRVQNCNGGCNPDAGYAGNMAATICNYKLQHPEYANRMVYLQCWNEPGDQRDYVDPGTYADYLVDAYTGIHQAEASAAAQNPAIAGTMMVMTPGQNGPAWWEQAFAHNPNAKNAFDVWATHPYPESDPPWFNLHDSVCPDNTVKCIDSYLLDLDKIAENHGGISRRGFPVMITETAWGDHLGISYEGYPKTTRQMAADYNVSAFRDYWYKWPEIRAVNPFILANWSWDAFGWVHCYSASVDTDGDGLMEPTDPFPQYTALKAMREGLEAQGKLAPARLTPFTGQTGKIVGTVTRAGAGTAVKYAEISTDGFEFGNVSLYDGGYGIEKVPVGTYTLTCHKNGYADATASVTVTNGGTATVNFSLTYLGKDPNQFLFIDTAMGQCSGCDNFGAFLGETFRTPSDIGYIKYCAAKPNVGGIYLKFTIIQGTNPNGTVVGTFNSYYLEPNFAGEMIGGEAPGDGIAVSPNTDYFLKVERLDGQGLYCYATDQNPYANGNLWVGNTSYATRDLYCCIRGNRVAAVTSVGTIAGRVVNSGGTGISGATVSTSPGSYGATTNSTGYYTISSVNTGTYSVTASKAGYTTSTQTGKTVTQNQTTTVNFTLNSVPTGTLIGNVKDGSNNNISGATVTTEPATSSVTTNASGNYTISGIGVGTYSVQAAKTGYTSSTATGVAVAQGTTTTQNFTLTSSVPWGGLTDTNFEGAYVDDPDIDHRTATGWTRFSIAGSSKAGGDYGVYRSTHWSQSIYESSWTAGIYQKCSGATLNNNYTASVYVRGSDANVLFWIGIDPNGGTDAASPNIQWSAQAAPGTTWTQISKQVKAQASEITVFVKSQNTAAVNKYAWIDDAAITSDGGGGGTTYGTITGTVKTTGGANISGAVITTNVGDYTATTNSSGAYTISNVAAATYDVTAAKSGYLTQTKTGQVVVGNQTTTCSFTMQTSGGAFSGISNGTFESGFFNDPDGDHQSGNSWHRFSIAGASKAGGDYGIYHSSHWGQTIYESSWTAGLYQQATGATSGANYVGTAWVRGYDTNDKFWIGIDPFGGTDANSANIEWSAESIPSTTWTQISKTATAQSSTITLFIKAQNILGANRPAWIDDATFTAQ